MISLRRLYGLPLIALSIFFFLYITGFNTNFINPRNIDWIFFFGNTDSTTAWFGWEYFRWTNFIQFPLITNYPYGEELNISLIYSGSIPIICLLLKPSTTLFRICFSLVVKVLGGLPESLTN